MKGGGGERSTKTGFLSHQRPDFAAGSGGYACGDSDCPIGRSGVGIVDTGRAFRRCALACVW